MDTAFVWQSDTGVVQALPDFVANASQSGLNGASAISADGRYIASQARLNATAVPIPVRAVRVDRNSLPSPLANLNLNSFLPTLSTARTTALGISTDGAILYGQTLQVRAFRVDVTNATSALIPFLGTDTQNTVATRGISANGNVAVGSSFNPGNHKAYRYVHGSPSGTLTAIPLLLGATYSDAVAVSPDGDFVLVTGNSAANPNGEAYLYQASTGAVTPLGSPNSAWSPGGRQCAGAGCQGAKILAGGMTSDGSVVAMTFGGSTDAYAYFHNPHGWFHLTSVLGANGVHIADDGWSTNSLVIQGMSPDGTLVFGFGNHNGSLEGFVAEFGANVLAQFDVHATVPADTSIVGVWSPDDVGAEEHFIVFLADGSYFQIEEGNDGFERGSYTYDGAVATITTRLDTNGSAGLSDDNGSNLFVSLVGDTLAGMHRIGGSPGSIVGGWVGGNPAEADNSLVNVVAGNTYGAAYDFDDDESETGTYTWNPVTGELIAFPTGGAANAGNVVTPSPDGLSLLVVDQGGAFTLTRIVDPASVPVIAGAPLFASGIAGQAFSFLVNPTTTHPVTFTSTQLPTGLVLNPSTGQISGTPAIGGQFVITITVTNAVGVSNTGTLTLTIAIPTPVGQNVVVEPTVPEGQGPVTLSFGEITSEGTTTVTVVEQSAVPPPGNVAVGGVIYEVTTTATYTGLINLCFSYAGIDFGAATPRLFHYENNAWVDITTSVDSNTQTICGATTTLSPFAVLISDVVRTGFDAPVNPIAGFLNVVKAGSTVPLKFNVVVNGVQQTTTAGIVMTVQAVSCDANAPLDDVEPAQTTGGTSLRYDESAHRFIQNWKVPKSPGCYMVRMTTTQDGLALTARFKVK
jgi:hypothetical protein